MSDRDRHPLKDYALWLVPTTPPLESAQQVVADLSKHERHSPIFSPHITLFHPISILIPLDEITKKLDECIKQAGLAEDNHTLSLSLNPAQSGTHYYQSVLSPVSSHDHLSALRQAIESAFEWKSDKPYFPHLSLLYGDLSRERRDELAGIVNTEMELPKNVEIRDIAIVDCTGTADQWKMAGTVSLGLSL